MMKNSKKILTNYKADFLYKAYRILLSVLLAVFALLLCISCVELYRSGDPFSRESVAAAFQKIAPIAYTSIAAVIGIALFSFFYERQEKRLKALPDPDEILRRLSLRVENSLSKDTAKRIKKEHRLRTVLQAISAALCVVGSVFAAVYALNKNNLPTDDINGAIAELARMLIAAYALPLLFSLLSALLKNASRKREIALLKEALKNDPGSSVKNTETSLTSVHNSRKALNIIRTVILFCGAGLLILGFINGGNEDVVQKAIKICRECIGLG